MVCVSATAGGDPGRGQVCFLAFLVVRAEWDWVQHTGSESDRKGHILPKPIYMECSEK